MIPIDSWPDPDAGTDVSAHAPTPHGEAMLRSYGFDRAVDYGMSLDDMLLLEKRVRGGAGWVQVLSHLGEDNLQRAARQIGRQHAVSASSFFLHAAACFRLAQAGSEEDAAVRIALYERQVDAFARGVALCNLGAASVDLDYGGAAHRAWFVPVAGRAAPSPCVLVWGGADGWCEAFWRSVPTFLERGLAVCLLELPGQGLARLRDGSHLASSFTAMVGEAIDRLSVLGVDSKRIGVVGHSLGGTLAMAAAVADSRIRACVSNGGSLDRRLDDKYPRATRRMERMLGPDGDAGTFYRALDLSDRLPSMSAKLLCLQGGRDVLVADEEAQRIVALRGEAAATLAYWPDGVHCIYNHALERNALAGDWLAQTLCSDIPSL